MTSSKYIGMDVHKESISIAVRNAAGKIVMVRRFSLEWLRKVPVPGR